MAQAGMLQWRRGGRLMQVKRRQALKWIASAKLSRFSV